MTGAALAPAIGAKLHAMYGRRLTDAQFEEMARKRTVGEVAGYLKTQTWFSVSLSNMQENEIHRGQLELLLGRALFDEVQCLKRYDRGHPLFEQYLAYREMQQVVSCIGFLQEGRQNAFLASVPGYLIPVLSLDWSGMVHATEPAELVQALRHSRYGKVVEDLLRQDGTFPTLSICSAALASEYYATFLQWIALHYKGRERTDLERLLHLQIEAGNLAAAYRLIRFFHVEPEQIRRRLVPVYSTLKKKQIDELLYAPDADAFEAILRKTRAGHKMNESDFSFIEGTTERYRLQLCQQIFPFTTSAAVAFQCFLTLREVEQSNVLRVVEGVRYSVPADEILALLVRADAGGEKT